MYRLYEGHFDSSDTVVILKARCNDILLHSERLLVVDYFFMIILVFRNYNLYLQQIIGTNYFLCHLKHG